MPRVLRTITPAKTKTMTMTMAMTETMTVVGTLPLMRASKLASRAVSECMGHELVRMLGSHMERLSMMRGNFV